MTRNLVEDEGMLVALRASLVKLHPDLVHLPITGGWVTGVPALPSVSFWGVGNSASGLISLLLDMEDPCSLGEEIATPNGCLVVWFPDSMTGLGCAVGVPSDTHPDALLDASDYIGARLLERVEACKRQGSFDGVFGVGIRETTGKPYIYCVPTEQVEP